MQNRITRSFYAATFALCYAFTANAQPVVPASTSPVAPSPVIQQRTATPALWVVKDADTTIYLFGTFHFLPEGLNWNLGAVKAAFESADTLKLEIANLEAEAPAIGAIMEKNGKLPAGASLSDGLTPAQKAKLGSVISEAGIPTGALDTMRPWMASIVMTLTLYQKMGFDPAKGVDMTLDGMARARNIPVQGFETGAEQIDFFAKLTPAQERALLLSTLDDWDQAKTALDGMVNAWARGDAERIGRLLSESLRTQPELSRVILTDRNSKWADWIGARMDTPGTVFVAVGAGHLAGRDSVQSYLRKKGLRARRVANPPRR